MRWTHSQPDGDAWRRWFVFILAVDLPSDAAEKRIQIPCCTKHQTKIIKLRNQKQEHFLSQLTKQDKWPPHLNFIIKMPCS